MTQFRDEKIIGIIKEKAAKYLSLEASKSSLLTVTNVTLSTDGKEATIFFTAFPADKEKTALEFAKRKRREFQEYMRDETKLGRLPMFDFEIDEGEKNRQKIDTLSQEAFK